VTKVSAGKSRLVTKLSRSSAIVALSAGILVVGSSGTQNAIANGDTRTLSFYHTHSKERITVTFKKNGRYDQSALKQLNHFLRDWRNQKETTMEPRLFDVVWEVQKDAGSREPIQIISAYRSPETNAMLRSRSSGVAKFSQHTLGHAMDIHVPDVPMSKIREAGLRLQRGGVGFYPSSGTPFVHLDVGNVRMWPRMSRDQLAKVFPDGRTVHLPADGKPLKNYALALADLKRNGATVKGMPASSPTMVASNTSRSGGFLSRMIGGGDDDEETTAPVSDTTPATAVAKAPPPAPETAPAPTAVAAIASIAPVPMPSARPAMAYAAPEVPAGPQMAWQAGPQAAVGRASAAYELAALQSEPSAAPPTPAAQVAMPMPRPLSSTTPAALTAANAPGVPMPAMRPAPVAASAGGLATSGAEAARLLAAAVRDVTQRRPKPQPVQTAALRSSPNVLDKDVPAVALSPNRTMSDPEASMAHPDFAQVNGMLSQPTKVLAVTFTANPTGGLDSGAFKGSSVALLRTQSFGPQQTATLLPRG
jgi:uncharacterized protein YcbK (DUF882 family)